MNQFSCVQVYKTAAKNLHWGTKFIYLYVLSKSWNRRAATDGCNGQVHFYSPRCIELSGIVVRESRLDACDQEWISSLCNWRILCVLPLHRPGWNCFIIYLILKSISLLAALVASCEGHCSRQACVPLQGDEAGYTCKDVALNPNCYSVNGAQGCSQLRVSLTKSFVR